MSEKTRAPVVTLLVLDALGLKTMEFLFDRVRRRIDLPWLVNHGLGSLLHARFYGRFPPIDGNAIARSISQASLLPDSYTGHNEMMGGIDRRQFSLFFDGMPTEYVRRLEERWAQKINAKVIFNKMAGGDAAIKLNVEEHLKCAVRGTITVIGYSSMCDPLFQFAAHESVITPAVLAWMVKEAFDLAWEMGIRVTRTIARPFVNRPGGGYKRTTNRRDAVLPPSYPCLVNILRRQGVRVESIGKPSDMVQVSFDLDIHKIQRSELCFDLQGTFVDPDYADANPGIFQGVINRLHYAAEHPSEGMFIWGNAVDADSLWGHNRLAEQTVFCLEMIDIGLRLVHNAMQDDNILLLVNDHGMVHVPDLPGHPGYGYHNDEPLMFIALRKGSGGDLGNVQFGTCPGLTDVGAVIAQIFGYADEYRASITRITG